MRHATLLAAALAAAAGLFGHDAAAQTRSPAPPAHGPAAPAPPIALDTVAARASLDGTTRARIAPHIVAMNEQLVQLRQLTARVPRESGKAEQDRLHKDLAQRYAAFQKSWDAARALVPAGKRPAFDAAVREQMGATGRVGNPHGTLPPSHPKLNAQGGKAP